MISAAQIQDILSLYQKHGWILRRLLLSAKLKKHLAENLEMFSDAEIVESQIDAAWFSRPSGKEKQAWELRHLSETPFALFEVFELGTENEICEEIRRGMEITLQERQNKKP
jgi:hypothetical protein